MPVTVSFNRAQTRAAFELAHPKGNLLTMEIVTALRAALETIVENPHLRLVTIEGAGQDFSFGASIPEHAPAGIGRVLPEMHRLIVDLLELPVPTAAVVAGRCLGGGFELALACDLIFAADTAVFGLPEIALGVFPPAASVLLPARVGAARAMPAILTGEPRSAREWFDAGLVSHVADESVLANDVERWFDRHLASKSAVALRHAAVAARGGLLAHVRQTLPVVERLYLDDLMRTQDAIEGIEAFMQKREPRWFDR